MMQDYGRGVTRHHWEKGEFDPLFLGILFFWHAVNTTGGESDPSSLGIISLACFKHHWGREKLILFVSLLQQPSNTSGIESNSIFLTVFSFPSFKHHWKRVWTFWTSISWYFSLWLSSHCTEREFGLLFSWYHFFHVFFRFLEWSSVLWALCSISCSLLIPSSSSLRWKRGVSKSIPTDHWKKGKFESSHFGIIFLHFFPSPVIMSSLYTLRSALKVCLNSLVFQRVSNTTLLISVFLISVLI